MIQQPKKWRLTWGTISNSGMHSEDHCPPSYYDTIGELYSAIQAQKKSIRKGYYIFYASAFCDSDNIRIHNLHRDRAPLGVYKNNKQSLTVRVVNTYPCGRGYSLHCVMGGKEKTIAQGKFLGNHTLIEVDKNDTA